MFPAFARLGVSPARALVAVLAALACLWMTPAAAQTAARRTAAAPTRAVVLTPLSFITTRAMDFGRIATRNAVSTVTINPAAGTCAVSAGTIRVGVCQPGEFAGRGVRNAIVRLRIETASTTLTGPGAAMTLNNFTADGGTSLTYIGAPGNPRYRIVTPTGVFTFRVGATLRVNANQAPGAYRGTFSVRADYQ